MRQAVRLHYTAGTRAVGAPPLLPGVTHTALCPAAPGYAVLCPAPQVPFKYVDDLATVWCEWAEMELRAQNFRSALELLRRATAEPEGRNPRITPEEERKLPVQQVAGRVAGRVHALPRRGAPGSGWGGCQAVGRCLSDGGWLGGGQPFLCSPCVQARAKISVV